MFFLFIIVLLPDIIHAHLTALLFIMVVVMSVFEFLLKISDLLFKVLDLISSFVFSLIILFDSRRLKNALHLTQVLVLLILDADQVTLLVFDLFVQLLDSFFAFVLSLFESLEWW
jgi:hypothetical protein